MQTDELADHLFGSVLGALDVLTVHIGDQFGIYDLLHRDGPLSAEEVAERSGMHERYAREWLEQQTVAGLIDVRRPRPAGRRAPLLALRRARGRARRPGQPVVLHAVRADGRRRGGPAPRAPGRLPHRRGRRLGGLRAADADRAGRREPPAVPRPARPGLAAGAARGAPRPHRRRAGRRRRLRRGLVLDRDGAGLPGRPGRRVRRGPGERRRGPTARRVVRRRTTGSPSTSSTARWPAPTRAGRRGRRLRPGHRLRVHPRPARPGVRAGPGRGPWCVPGARCW